MSISDLKPEIYGVPRPGPARSPAAQSPIGNPQSEMPNPALDSLRDDVREFLEFGGTAIGRLGERLGDIEQALGRGELGTALHLLRQAKTTQVVIAKNFARATTSLDQEAQ